LPSASNFSPFDMSDGLRKIVVSPVFGSYFQMLPACRYLPDSSLHAEVKVMSEKYIMPSLPAATPSVRTQPFDRTARRGSESDDREQTRQ
jgi:hypothetical protein